MSAWQITGLPANTATSNGPLPTVTTALNVGGAEKKMDETTEPAKVYPVVLITWADAHCGDGGWQELEEYDDDGEIIVNTVGYLVPADEPGGKKDHVTVWQTISDGEGIHPFHIPAGMVRNVAVLT